MTKDVEELLRSGVAARREGRLDVAVRCYEEAAVLFEDAGDALRQAHTVRHVGDILCEMGRVEEARPRYEEALHLYRSHGGAAPLEVANAVRGCARMREEMGALEEASSLWHEAKGIYAALGVEAGVVEGEESLRRLDGLMRARVGKV
jgi:tetratricopeptide (TPR) repeat protein